MTQHTPHQRLAWIARAHASVKNTKTERAYCDECESSWPCPTYIVATQVDVPGDPFEERDQDLYRRAGLG